MEFLPESIRTITVVSIEDIEGNMSCAHMYYDEQTKKIHQINYPERPEVVAGIANTALIQG